MTPATLPLIKAGLICFVFFLVELAAGWWAGSLAILSDSVHMLTDVIGYCVAIAAVEIGTWPATKSYTFGFARVELIGALISLFLTWNLVFGLIQEALHRINEPSEINAPAMLISALFGVAANSFMAFMLQDPHHDHDHDHHHHHHNTLSSGDDDILATSESVEMKQQQQQQQQPSSPTLTLFNPETSTLFGSGSEPEVDIESNLTPTKVKNNNNPSSNSIQNNINVQAAMIHILGDLLGSISILIAATILTFKPSWTVLDPLCTILFSIIIFVSSLGLAKQYIMILMETCPSGVDVEDVRCGVVENVVGVVEVEAVRCWSLTQGKECCILRVVVSSGVVKFGDGGRSGGEGKAGKKRREEGFGIIGDVDMYSSTDVTEEEVVKLVTYQEEDGDRNGYNQILDSVREYLKSEFGFEEICIEIRVAS